MVRPDEKFLEGHSFFSVLPITKAVIEQVFVNGKIPDGLEDGKILANDLKAMHEAHRIVSPAVHNLPDSTNVVTAAAATTEALYYALLNNIKAMHNAHCADATAHNSADVTNVITLPDATNIQSAMLLANDIKVKQAGHYANVTAHDGADTVNLTTKPDVFAWYQEQPEESGIKFSFKRGIKYTMNRNQGKTGTFGDGDVIKITVPISATNFDTNVRYVNPDPRMAAGAVRGFYRENKGIRLTGYAVLIIPYNDDLDNFGDIPDFAGSPDEVKIFWNCVNEGEVIENYNGNQNVLGLELTPLTDKTADADKGKGTTGGFGTFLKVS